MIHRIKLAEKRTNEAAERDFLSSLCVQGPTRSFNCFVSHRIKQKIFMNINVFIMKENNLCSIDWYLEFSPVHWLSHEVFFPYLLSLASTLDILFQWYVLPQKSSECAPVCAQMFPAVVALVMLNKPKR